jgi:type I restriction enzyme R subunit
MELSDETLKKIAHELVDIVRRDAKTDWNVKEQVEPSSAPQSSAFYSSTGIHPTRSPPPPNSSSSRPKSLHGRSE